MNNSGFERPLTSVFTDGFFRFLVLILLFLALLFSQKNIILIAILILIMVYVLKIWSQYSARNIRYSFDAEKKKGFPGETISIQARVSNRKLLPIWLKLSIPMDKRLIPQKKREDDCLVEQFSLLWYDQFLWRCNLKAEQRGCFQLGPPFLETGDLLGFFKEKTYLSQSKAEVIIYPKPISLNFLATPVKELFGKTGINNPVKDPIYPVATRDYQQGEPAKFIHWKASARHNNLQSKIFDSSTQRKTLLIIDVDSFSENKAEELFEKTLEVVAALILEFDRKGSPFGILSNGRTVGENFPSSCAFGTGSEQISQAMELLARLTIEKSCALEEILFKDIIIPAGTGCLYLAYNINNENIRHSQILQEHNIPPYFMMAQDSSSGKIASLPVFLLSEIYGEAIELSQTESRLIANY